jgi:hypothetical protein
VLSAGEDGTPPLLSATSIDRRPGDSFILVSDAPSHCLIAERRAACSPPPRSA